MKDPPTNGHGWCSLASCLRQLQATAKKISYQLKRAITKDPILAVRRSAAQASNYEAPTTLRCRRRPKRKPCRGSLTIFFDVDTFDVLWFCPVCDDQGRISGWEGTFWDNSENRGGSLLAGFRAAARRSRLRDPAWVAFARDRALSFSAAPNIRLSPA